MEIIGSETVDLGGPRQQFFNTLHEGLARNECLRFFERDIDEGWVLPSINRDAIMENHRTFYLIRRSGISFSPPPVYHYLVLGTIESVIPYLDIKFLCAWQRAIVD